MQIPHVQIIHIIMGYAKVLHDNASDVSFSEIIGIADMNCIGVGAYVV